MKSLWKEDKPRSTLLCLSDVQEVHGGPKLRFDLTRQLEADS